MAKDEENRLTPATDVDGLTEKERDSVAAQSRPSAALIHETIRAEGESELERTASALLFSGLAAGLSIGLSLMAEGLLRARLPETEWSELVSKLGYSVGFVVVVLGRQQLFTENTLTPILPLLYHRDRRTLFRVLRLWVLVLAANMVGTFLIAFGLTSETVFDEKTRRAFGEISSHVVEGPFYARVLAGVFAGWLIALMTWLLPAANTSRLLVIVLITYMVSLGGFAHIVAGSVDASYLLHTGEIGPSDYFGRFFLPTLIGNLIGGVALVAALNYGQVAPEVEPQA